MMQIHVNAAHVSLIRLGGYVQLDQQITDQDWDNWRYIERANRLEDDRVCRRGLRSLRKVYRNQRRRRHATPGRRDDGGDDEGGDGPEEMSGEEYQRRMESSDPEDWPMESHGARRERYRQSTMSECSDPDEWARLHYGGERAFNEDASRSADDSPDEEPEGEDGESGSAEDESPASSDRDTVVSEFMQNEYLEWPVQDYTSSQDRAQLTAYQWIRDWSLRQARAIRDSNMRLASWCNQQIGVRRIYARVGSITLNQ